MLGRVVSKQNSPICAFPLSTSVSSVWSVSLSETALYINSSSAASPLVFLWLATFLCLCSSPFKSSALFLSQCGVAEVSPVTWEVICKPRSKLRQRSNWRRQVALPHNLSLLHSNHYKISHPSLSPSPSLSQYYSSNSFLLQCQWKREGDTIVFLHRKCRYEIILILGCNLLLKICCSSSFELLYVLQHFLWDLCSMTILWNL